ncbi:MAG: hypothetical protein PHY29_11215 [Syntrophales bacterium]|nr:hypothetical protein [Syntrophales bacterium]
MRKLLLGLLALSLVLAFAMPAAAVDVSVSGTYYIAGYYDDNGDLMTEPSGAEGSSSAWYNQRLRVETTFAVSPALMLITRFDAMEGFWNGESGPTSPGAANTDDSNIDFDRVYVQADTEYGRFTVGYQAGSVWATSFADAVSDVPRIKWQAKLGEWLVGFVYEKAGELDRGTQYTDRDIDKYMPFVIKYFEGGSTGLRYIYADNAAFKPAGYDQTLHLFMPYVKAKVGDLYVEAEAVYALGAFADYDDPSITDVDKDGLSAYVNAKYTVGNAYVGGQIAWVEGDDPTTNDNEAGTSGFDYNPCLILWNDDLQKWSGQNLGQGNPAGVSTGDTMTNAWLYQIYAGVSPLPNLDLLLSYSYAKADEKGSALDDKIGSELDVTATYKLFDNLDYMVGFGYFWAGDWYKGSSAAATVDDDYVLMNKLTLSF